MKVRNLVLAGLLAVTSAAGALVLPGAVWADLKCPAGTLRAGETVNALAECNVPKDSEAKVKNSARNIINVVLGVVGVIAVFVMILGGIGFVTSQGDAAKVAKAKNTLIWGAVGLIVALLAFAIVNFVLGNVFNPATPAASGDPTAPTGS